MKKILFKKMKLVISIVVCLLFITVTYSPLGDTGSQDVDEGYNIAPLLLVDSFNGRDVTFLVDLEPRWNLVSIPYNTTLDKADLIVHYGGTDYTWEEAIDPANGPLVDSFIFGWIPGTSGQIYQTINVVDPSYGYWIYAYQSCQLLGDVEITGGADDDWEWSSGSGITGDIYHTGNVGIGTLNPMAKLDVFGSIAVNGIEVIDDTGEWVGEINISGNVTINSINTTYINISGPIDCNSLNASGGINCDLMQIGDINSTKDTSSRLTVFGNISVLEGLRGSETVIDAEFVTTPGDIKSETGNIFALEGNVTAKKHLIAEQGHIESAQGDVIANQSLISEQGDIKAVDGNITAMNGGDIKAISGDVEAELGDVIAGNDIKATDGDILTLNGGDIKSTHGNISSGNNISAVGTINATGDVISDNILTAPILRIIEVRFRNMRGPEKEVIIKDGVVNASGDIKSGTGNIFALQGNVTANKSLIAERGHIESKHGNITANKSLIAEQGDIKATEGSIITENGGDIKALHGNVTASEGKIAGKELDATGNVSSTKNVSAGGNITATHDIIADQKMSTPYLEIIDLVKRKMFDPSIFIYLEDGDINASGVITASGGNSTEWNTAFGWGDHSIEGYLTSYTETDPVFTTHDASAVTSTKIGNWDTAFGWGDHSIEGYLKSYTETDPIFTTHDASAVTSTKIGNWDTAFGWGDHSIEGYLKSYTETDPIFTTHDASAVTSTKIGNWDTAFGWGDHSLVGYDFTDDSWFNSVPIGVTTLYDVGIGTMSPSEKLTIVDPEPEEDVNILIGKHQTSEFGLLGWHPGAVPYLYLKTFNDLNDIILNPSSAETSGNVGIGTTSPSSKLEVAGMIHSTSHGFRFPDGTVQSTASTGGGSCLWTQTGSNIYYTDGNVGIGTMTPTSDLEVDGVIKSTGSGVVVDPSNPLVSPGIHLHSDSSFDKQAYIDFWNQGSSLWMIGSDLLNENTRNFGIRDNQAGATRFYIDNIGNVGIGTTNPSEDLHVVGDIYCTGKLTSDGGNDPPYVLYNKETRESIIERVAKEVPQDKLEGAVLFWNGETFQFEIYLPLTGEFRDILGNPLTEEPENNLNQKIADLETRIAELEALIK